MTVFRRRASQRRAFIGVRLVAALHGRALLIGVPPFGGSSVSCLYRGEFHKMIFICGGLQWARTPYVWFLALLFSSFSCFVGLSLPTMGYLATSPCMSWKPKISCAKLDVAFDHLEGSSLLLPVWFCHYR